MCGAAALHLFIFSRRLCYIFTLSNFLPLCFFSHKFEFSRAVNGVASKTPDQSPLSSNNTGSKFFSSNQPVDFFHQIRFGLRDYTVLSIGIYQFLFGVPPSDSTFAKWQAQIITQQNFILNRMTSLRQRVIIRFQKEMRGCWWKMAMLMQRQMIILR